MDLNQDEHRLNPVEHQRIFEAEIVPDVFASAKHVEQPVAVIFGGQPGAGKSAAVAAAVADLEGQGGSVQIIGDDFRSYHPAYQQLLRSDDKTAAFYTDRDTGQWVEKAIAHARNSRVNVVIEGTMRDPDKVAQTMTLLRAAGYRIHVQALAVNARFSQQGILQRYEGQKLDRGTGRMTTHQAHMAAYRGMPHTLERIERDRLADRITLLRRGVIPIYENELKAGQWARQPAAREALEAERSRPLTLAEHRSLIAGYAALLDMHKQPGRNPTTDEHQQLAELHSSAQRDFTANRHAILNAEAAAKLADNLAELGRDPRYAEHTRDELARAAYVRGIYQTKADMEGTTPDLDRFDAAAADRLAARQLPAPPEPVSERDEAAVTRQRDDDQSHER